MKLPDNAAAFNALAAHRALKHKVVFTNGCFDILHVGHLRYLSEARSLGDVLVVGLNSDYSVRRLKGDRRPIVPQEERREMLLGLRSVDIVLIFDEDTPAQIIAQVRPDVLVKGGDWAPENIVGADLVQSYGGEVHSLSFVEGKSTTNIIGAIKAAVS